MPGKGHELYNKENDSGNRRILLVFSVCIIALAVFVIWITSDEKVARPSVNGALHVEGTHLVDEAAERVVLRGVSTHGLTWFPQFDDESVFRQLSEGWNSNLIRLAMYSTEYCNGKKNESLDLAIRGVDAAIVADMYVLVDWHVLGDKDPNVYAEEAADFFDFMTRRYSGVPNVIYEICNEPNGDTKWEDVKRYADHIIPVIRANSPDAVVMVGTPEFCQDLESVFSDPLDAENVMYTCHFYAGTHYDELQTELDDAVSRGLPVFITECGITEAEGDGRDYDNSAKWFSYLRKHDMGFAVWSLSNKDEPSAMVKPMVTDFVPLVGSKLTDTGLWVRELVRGMDPELIPDPDKEDLTFQDRNPVSRLIYRLKMKYREFSGK